MTEKDFNSYVDIPEVDMEFQELFSKNTGLLPAVPEELMNPTPPEGSEE